MRLISDYLSIEEDPASVPSPQYIQAKVPILLQVLAGWLQFRDEQVSSPPSNSQIDI